MSGGAPVPVPVAEKILCIADLKEAGSKKLPTGPRGMSGLAVEVDAHRLAGIGRRPKLVPKDIVAK